MELIEEEDLYFDGKDLFKKAMAGDWNDLVDMYRKYPLARSAKVTRAKNTVLHLAVSNEDDYVVKQLVNAIEEEEARALLSLQNNLGNTPLHVAAALGLPRICWLLAQKCKELVVMARNSAGETPLYIAARHGKKRTFFVLQDFVPETLERTLHFCQRGDGNTILHAAVHGEYFGLAIEIIKLYPRLVNFYNEIGQTPLHLLANMPLAFRSGSRLGGIDKFIYSRIIVDRLEQKYKPRIYEGQLNGWKKEKEINMPKDYATFMNSFQLLHHIYRLICILKVDTMKKEKIKHEHASQVMKELVHHASYWEYVDYGKLSNKEHKQDEIAITIIKAPDEESSASESSIGIIMQTKNLKKDDDKKAGELIEEKLDTPILIAAKQGVIEMVKSILDIFPEAVQDLDSNHKNIVLLSAEHRQIHVYKHLLERKPMRESFFGMVDKDGNTALHLVARFATTNHPWLIPKNIALQLQRECKWYKFVENSMEPGFFQHYNNMGETAMGIFSKSHESLVKEGGKWLANISQSCSVIAVLVAGVAYASATTVPGGLDQTSGFPILAKKSTFKWFTWSALAAFYSSILSLLIFLSILTSSFGVNEFRRKVPMELRMGLETLFVSISMMLLSFMDGFLVMKYKHITYAPIYYAVSFYLAIAFVFSEVPFYFDLMNSSIVDAT